jgi:hypothetical protein
MKVYAVMTLGRQHLGDYFFLRAEKAFTDLNKANVFVEQVRKSIGRGLVRITTPNGTADCQVEVVTHEFEIED